MSTTHVHVSLLGPIEVTVGGQHMPIGGPGSRALLTALSLNIGRTLSVPELLEVIWDDRPPMTATTKLQGHVSALRKSFTRLGGPDAAHVIQTKPPGYVLCQHRGATDVTEFGALLDRAAKAGPARLRADLLTAALAMWRAPSACFGLRSSWLIGMADALDQRRWSAMEDLAEARLALGDRNAAIEGMEILVRRAPYRERAWEHLIAAHLDRRDIGAALAVHDRFRAILHADLGIEPGPRIARLIAGIRAGAALGNR